MPRLEPSFDVIVIGSGHAGAEAAWAAAGAGARTALLTMDPGRSGQMSCNPAIGGLAKGQIVREIDALGGLMGLAADATGIQFRILNRSRGPAVQGPRCQSDKAAYARQVQRLLATRRNLTIYTGRAEHLRLENGAISGVTVTPGPCHAGPAGAKPAAGAAGPFPSPEALHAPAVVLTTGTFMRGLMHTGATRTPGGRAGEPASAGLSGALERLGFELGRLKTGTPPRLAKDSIDWAGLEEQPGDPDPVPFSDLSGRGGALGARGEEAEALAPVAHRFPVLEQRPCHLTRTTPEIHALIRRNLDQAPLYNGQIATPGPRYCPSIEDKVVRFADRESHHVFLEPEGLASDEIYCNGISSSLPAPVQARIVRGMPGCERARMIRPGYAVEYDMVLPHQIDATTMTKRVPGLFLAGQVNGTTGYEEAAGQGWLAGVNAARLAAGEALIRLGRDEAYIGVLMDDLVTKVPREPYRMFTSRAEHRLLLRADNAPERLTPIGRRAGTVGAARWRWFTRRREAAGALEAWMAKHRVEAGVSAAAWLKRPEADPAALRPALAAAELPPACAEPGLLARLAADIKYAGYIDRQREQVQALREEETTALPRDLDYRRLQGLRTEARQVLERFRPATLGQAGRLAGINPSDVMLLSVALKR